MDNYGKIIKDNLARLYKNRPDHLAQLLPGKYQNEQLIFKAFGSTCRIGTGGITVGDKTESGVIGILISLYALHAKAEPCIPTPFKAYREIPNSMPYAGAFASHTEQILIPHIDKIEDNRDLIFEILNGETGTGSEGGDFSFVVRPFPKVQLNYIFYRADDDFPASATCLFSNNALSFLPVDALADTGEYTSRKIIDIISSRLLYP
ncbi:hypothetical protein D1BOALGB6SA_9650 [Olavius sp. associated proteobacterium Delta 1]|nr:hypothetical protein D1BOALGB6SA_9650 [Olavius sp. associated proteobacterium Delta 1]